MKDFGYRTEEFSGSGVRCIYSVLKYEIFELCNLDILYTILNTNLVMDSDSYYIRDLIDDIKRGVYFEDTIKDEAIYQVISRVRKKTGFNLKYCLWLTDKKYVKKIYNATCIDTYYTSSIILSDLGNDGKLFAYESYPNKII